MSTRDSRTVENDTFADLDAMVREGRLSQAAADAIRDAVTGADTPITPETRRERLAAWIGSINSDASDASTTIRETLRRAYADKKQPAD